MINSFNGIQKWIAPLLNQGNQWVAAESSPFFDAWNDHCSSLFYPPKWHVQNLIILDISWYTCLLYTRDGLNSTSHFLFLAIFWGDSDLCLAGTAEIPMAGWGFLKFQAVLSYLYSYPGWWFGTFFIFPYIGNNHPNWLIFFKGVQTTNQIISRPPFGAIFVNTLGLCLRVFLLISPYIPSLNGKVDPSQPCQGCSWTRP